MISDTQYSDLYCRIKHTAVIAEHKTCSFLFQKMLGIKYTVDFYTQPLLGTEYTAVFNY